MDNLDGMGILSVRVQNNFKMSGCRLAEIWRLRGEDPVLYCTILSVLGDRGMQKH